MNFTIPIRAQSSTSSQSRQLRDTFSSKLRKANRRQGIYIVLAVTTLLGTLITASTSGVSQIASASDNFSPESTVYIPTIPSASQNNEVTGTSTSEKITSGTNSPNTTTTVPKSTIPPTKTASDPIVLVTPVLPIVPISTTPPSKVMSGAQHVTSTPEMVSVASAETQPAAKPALASVTTASTQTITQPATSLPVDTASAIAIMTAAQASSDAKAVHYSSGSLASETRNRILILATVTALTAASLYAISFIGKNAQIEKRRIPIRYIDPAQEALGS